ncbi:MAG: sigma-54-dependent Fis family transcriptional regulator, partial [Gammaproteobacteria bacterium]|nr:sigma-54-dependent Fis family transcriptional regulator [Gammaproteobacteria bacterium]
IQEKSVRPVGAPQEIPVDVRIVSATHKNLSELVEAGEFRQDLYYRINVIELLIPPLRDRIDDIPILVTQSLKRMSTGGGSPVIQIGGAALKQLTQYTFPGNVRELENILERATALCENNSIAIDDLHLPTQLSTTESTPTAISELPKGTNLEQQLEHTERQIITQALEETHWNKTKAAKILGISFRALRYRLSKLGLE